MADADLEGADVAVTNLKTRLKNACRQLNKSPAQSCKAAAVLLPLATAGMVAQASEALPQDEWRVDSAVLFYTEADRVSAFEPVIQLHKDFGDLHIANFKLAVDVLTGASPNGAVASTQTQTYTRPSGNGSYTTAAGETPLDDTFHDTRVAFSGNWSAPLTDNISWSTGGNVSKEYDYLSLSANGRMAWEFNQRNSSLSFALSLGSDSWEPEGGVPLEGSCMFNASASTDCTETRFSETRRDSTENKTLTDWVIGFSQVLGRNMVSEFAISGSESSGYLSDPFKVVTVVDSATGDPLRHIHENRPDSRSKIALFGRVKTFLFGRDVLDVSLRHQTDDWGLSSNTLDMKYRFGKEHSWWEPRLRYYQQSAVDFYAPFLRSDQITPEDYTADSRQGNFDAITAGLEYGRTTPSGKQWQLALEFYQQTHDEPANKFGSLANLDVVPDLDAVMIRANFDF